MSQLYDDTGPPLLLCGYASVFNVLYRNGGQLERIAPGAFQLPGNVRLDVDHQGRCLASTYGGSLHIWQDHYGLAFEAALRPDWATLALMRAVHRGVFRSASFQNVGDGKGLIGTIEEKGRLAHQIRRLTLAEVSITTAGANPAACCWLGDEAVDQLPAGIAEARARWAIGRQERYLATHGAKAPAKHRPSACVMAKVDRVLAMADRRHGLRA